MPILIVRPQYTENMISNPSMETNATGWAAPSASAFVRTTDRAFRGQYAIRWLTPSGAGAFEATYSPINITNSVVLHSFSVWVYPTTAGDINIAAKTPGGAYEGAEVFTLEDDRWQRIHTTFNPSTTGAYSLSLRMAENMQIYIDAAQAENNDRDNAFEALNTGLPSTYCDGDEPACYWISTAHASKSQRRRQDKRGGYPYTLTSSQTDVDVLAGIIGFGYQNPAKIKMESPVVDGYILQGQKFGPRRLSVQLALDYATNAAYWTVLKNIMAPFNRDTTAESKGEQATRMIVDLDGMSEAVEIDVLYDGGLDGVFDVDTQQGKRPVIQMVAPTPTFRGRNDIVTDLNVSSQTSPTNFAGRVRGDWSAVSATGDSLTVEALAEGTDGRIYIGGAFTSLGGVTGADLIAAYDPTTDTYINIGQGVGDVVQSLLATPDGYIYIAGDFTSIGGVSNTNGICRYNIATDTIEAIGSGSPITNDNVSSLAQGPDGAIYWATGVTSSTNARLYEINGTTFSARGDATSSGIAFITDIAFDSNANLLYVCGLFDAVDAVTTYNVAAYDPAANDWVAINPDDSTPGTFNHVETTIADRIAFAGAPTIVSSASGVAFWTGNRFFRPVGDEDLDTTEVTGLHYADGLLYVGLQTGAATTTRGPSGATGNAGASTTLYAYDGSRFLPVEGVSGEQVNTVLVTRDGDLYIGYDGGVEVIVPTLTEIYYQGEAAVSPSLVLERTGGTTFSGLQLIHYGLGVTLVSQTFTIAPGEIITVNLSDGSAESNSRGDLGAFWDGGAGLTDWKLLPGLNQIGFLAPAADGSSLPSGVTAKLKYRREFYSIAGTKGLQ